MGPFYDFISAFLVICISLLYIVCRGSNDPFYIVTYNIECVTTSWTHSMYYLRIENLSKPCKTHHQNQGYKSISSIKTFATSNSESVLPGTSDPYWEKQTLLHRTKSFKECLDK